MDPLLGFQMPAFPVSFDQQLGARFDVSAAILSKNELDEADLAPYNLNQLFEIYVKVRGSQTSVPHENKLQFILDTISERCRSGEMVTEGLAPEAVAYATEYLLDNSGIDRGAQLAKALTATDGSFVTVLDQLSVQDLLAVSRAFYARWTKESADGKRQVYSHEIGFDQLFDKVQALVDEKVEREPMLFDSLPTESLILFHAILGHSSLLGLCMVRMQHPEMADFSRLQPQELLHMLLDFHRSRVASCVEFTQQVFERALAAFFTPNVLQKVSAESAHDILNFAQRYRPLNTQYFEAYYSQFQKEIQTFPDYRLASVLKWILKCDNPNRECFQGAIKAMHERGSEDTLCIIESTTELLKLLVAFSRAGCTTGSFIRARIDLLVRGEAWKFQEDGKSIYLIAKAMCEATRAKFSDSSLLLDRAEEFILASPSEERFAALTHRDLVEFIHYCGNRDKLHPLFEEELIKRLSQANVSEAFTFYDVQLCVQVFAKQCSAPLLELFAKWLLPHAKKGFDSAAICHFEALALKLLQQGLDTSQLLADKRSYLHTAVQYRLGVVTKELLSRKESVTRKDVHGNTPLHLACAGGDTAIISSLLAAGADPAILNNQKLLPVRYMRTEVQMQFYRGFEQVIRAYANGTVATLMATAFYIPEPVQVAEKINPLEVAFLMQNSTVTQAICSHLTETEAKEHFFAIKQKYPLATDYCGYYLAQKAYLHKRPEVGRFFTEEMSVTGLNRFGAINLVYNNVPHLKRMCERGIDVNYARQGITFLHVAFMQLSAEIARLLLMHGADPTRVSEQERTPVGCAHSRDVPEQKKREFWSALFADFPALSLHLRTNSIESITVELILQNGASNPLEVVLILGDRALALALSQALSREEFATRVAELKKKYPFSDCNFIEFAGVGLDLSHMSKRVKETPLPKPLGSSVSALLDIAKELQIEKKAAAELDKKFVQTILKKEVVMTPPAGTEAHKKFYEDVENALSHTFAALKTKESKQHVVDRCMGLIGRCAGALLPASIELYDQFVAGISPDFESALFEKLGDFRKALLETLTPNNAQSTHYNQVLVYALGKKEELNLPYKEMAYDDRVLRPDAVDPVAVKQKLLERYQEKVVPYVQEQLEQDGAFREKYFDAWKKLCPAHWKADLFEPICMGVADLESKKATREEITKFLASFEIQLGKDDCFYEAIEQERKARFLNEVYPMETGVLSRRWIVEMLQLQRVIAQ